MTPKSAVVTSGWRWETAARCSAMDEPDLLDVLFSRSDFGEKMRSEETLSPFSTG